MSYLCKYCGEEFETKQQLGGHSTYCEKNPKRQANLENLAISRKNINYTDQHNKKYFCKFCNKEIPNAGCLALHERSCKYNPHRSISENQLKKELDKERIEINKKLGIKRTLTEEHKQKIREGLVRWKEQNSEKYLNYSKQKSICCENFKDYLRHNNIDFVEEYSPYTERLYSLDIAFPDEKIGIEINGSQHYDSDGNLNQYTLEKQKFFEDRGWKIIQIYYRWCYGVLNKNEKITSILDLPIHNKQYVKEIYKRKTKTQIIKEQSIINKQNNIEKQKQIIYNMLYNSNIDFTKSGWSTKCYNYLKERNELFSKHIFQVIKKYFPEFLTDTKVWKRKGSKY